MEIKKDENGIVIPFTAEELQAEVERLEADKARVEEERENYKKGLLEREDKLKSLKAGLDNKEEEEEENRQWDENSTKFQAETLQKSTKVAEETTTKIIEAANEKQAIAEFKENNPDITAEQWEKIVANYDPKNGKGTAKSVARDLERAFVLYKFDSGEKIDPEEIRRTEAQRNLKGLNTTAGAGDGRYEENKETVSDGQLSIATRMRVSEDKLKEEDDSLSAEIKIS